MMRCDRRPDNRRAACGPKAALGPSGVVEYPIRGASTSLERANFLDRGRNPWALVVLMARGRPLSKASPAAVGACCPLPIAASAVCPVARRVACAPGRFDVKDPGGRWRRAR